MPYTPPGLADISQSFRASLRAALPGAEPGLWPNNLYVLTKTLSPVLQAFYQRLAATHLEGFAATCSSDSLELHGSEIGITRNAATVANGTATAVTVAATVIPMGTRLIRADGAAFLTLADVTAADVATSLALRAEAAGAGGNTLGGVTLTAETPIAGLGLVTVDADGLTGGADIENDASLRARILARKRNPPHGGSPGEYQQWARALPGVTRVFVQRATPAPGSVTVYIMTDASTATGIPSAGDVASLQALLNAAAPSSANVIVAGPSPVPVPITITGLTPNTARVQAAVQDEIARQFIRRAQPGLTFSRSWITEAISMATGEQSHQLTLPASDVACSAGQIAVPGPVTFL